MVADRPCASLFLEEVGLNHVADLLLAGNACHDLMRQLFIHHLYNSYDGSSKP